MFGKPIFGGSAALAGIAIIVAISFGLKLIDRGPIKKVVRIGSESLVVEIASTPEAQALGLSGRAGLPLGTGMLFVFQNPSRAGFWMKDMKFSIDIIWIDGDRVVDIASRVSPPGADGNVPRYYPRLPASYVLEVPAGFVQDHQVKIGDEVDLGI